MSEKEAILSCQNLYKRFGGVLAVDKVNLTLNKGIYSAWSERMGPEKLL